MERETLSFRQLMALLWAALLGPAAQLLPGETAGLGVRGALMIFASGVVLVLSGGMCGALSRQKGGLAAGLKQTFPPWLGTLFLYLYIIWGELLLVVRLRQSAQRLLGTGDRDGSAWFFLAVLAGMALWMGRGQLGALGRTAQLLLTALVACGGVVLLLALGQVRGVNLLLVEDRGALGTALGALPGFEVLGYGLFAAFLIQEKGEAPFRSWLRWAVVWCLVLALAQIIVVGCFGAVLTARLPSPFFQLAKSVGVEGAFQRLESVVSAVWAFSDLVLLSGILWAMRRLGAVLWPKTSPKMIVTAAMLPAAVIALALFSPDFSRWDAVGRWIPVGNVVLGFFIPLSAYIIKVRQRARRGNGTSCVSKQG